VRIEYKTSLPMESYDRLVIEEYEAKIADEKAIHQAHKFALRQAKKVFKWIYGYGGRTMQHDKERCAIWKSISEDVMRKYGLTHLTEADPTKLIEMNLYAIELMKDRVL